MNPGLGLGVRGRAQNSDPPSQRLNYVFLLSCSSSPQLSSSYLVTALTDYKGFMHEQLRCVLSHHVRRLMIDPDAKDCYLDSQNVLPDSGLFFISKSCGPVALW